MVAALEALRAQEIRDLVGAARPARGQDIESSMDIDFLDAVRGFQTAITLERPVECDTCHGNGLQPGSKPSQYIVDNPPTG